MNDTFTTITDIIIKAKEKAYRETSSAPEPGLAQPVEWPVQCTVGPGLEGAIACESKVGYVNGAKGWLIYRGYDIFDLCAHSTYEEVSYLLLHGQMPTAKALEAYKAKLVSYRRLNKTLRRLMGFAVEEMNAMAALRLGTNLMRHDFTYLDQEEGRPTTSDAIGSDEDSIAMETLPRGEEQATYEFKNYGRRADHKYEEGTGIEACYHLIAGVATITAAIARVKQGHMPIEPDPELNHAANFLYMMTGKRPDPLEERIMDIALILHADHGMNASTFASMVVASTLSDIYFSIGSGIAALSGPLHGGANEQVMHMLSEISAPDRVDAWLDTMLKDKKKVSGFGHRVYNAYDPRARILGPLASFLIENNPEVEPLFSIAQKLEEAVAHKLGEQKKIFPNVDFYSGIVYSALSIPPELFTPIFAVSRVAGWTARILEYLQNNRIFRPRAMYAGEFNNTYTPIDER